MGAKVRKPSPRGRNSIPGQVEARLERAAEVWRRRCQGATYATISAEMHIPLSTIFSYIEEQRTILREKSTELAERERDQALELLDNAIEKVVPHINGQIVIETIIVRGDKTVTMSVEEWQARMKGCQVLVSLLDRKAKLLSMDAPVKVEAPPPVAPETEEQRARAREALKMWTKFRIDPKDFQGNDLD